jgi:hypothetical protein
MLEDNDPYYEVGEAAVVGETSKALRMVIDGIGKLWVPKSQIHANSEVYESGHAGTLVVTDWFARKQGWI